MEVAKIPNPFAVALLRICDCQVPLVLVLGIVSGSGLVEDELFNTACTVETDDEPLPTRIPNRSWAVTFLFGER